MAPRGIGPRQLAVLAALEDQETGLSARELAQEVFGGDDAWNHDPLESEIRSTYRAARRLEDRGLVVARWVFVRDFGDELVFGLPNSRALGFGGDRSTRKRRIARGQVRPSPVAETLRIDQAASEARVREHAQMRESPPFRAQLTRLSRLSGAMVQLVRASWLHSSRSSTLVNESLMYAGTDDTLQTIVAIHVMAEQGIHNTVRRECRFLLESAVKHRLVDQRLSGVATAPRSQRIKLLTDSIPRSSIEPVWDLRLSFGDADMHDKFKKDVKGTWSSLAAYVHPSAKQVNERLEMALRGAYIGLEHTQDLLKLIDELHRVYDLLGVLWLEAAGPSATGDILVDLDQPSWAFKSARWLRLMSQEYDYKR